MLFKEVDELIKRITAILCIVAIIFNISGCKNRESSKYSAQFLDFFDTVTEVVAYMDTKDEFTEYAQIVYDSLKEYHELYDIYHDYEGIQNIKTINDNAGIAPVKVDGKIIDMLLFAKEAYEKTDGNTNVAMGSVLSIWHNYREKGIENPEQASLPSMEELSEASKHANISKVIIDQEASTVYLEDTKMSLDVGAIAKGYATEQVCNQVMDLGYSTGLLSVGGNIRAIGDKGAQHEYWNVAIQNPDLQASESNLFVLELKNSSLVTSGDYERFYTVSGKNYHHIIDPKTLMPATYFTSISIICEDSGLADALSTAVFNMPYEEGRTLIEGFTQTEAVWVFPNGDIKYTDGFEKLIHES